MLNVALEDALVSQVCLIAKLEKTSLSNLCCGYTMLNVALEDALVSQVCLIAKLEKTSLSN